MVGMTASDERWSNQDFAALVDHARGSLQESVRCRDNGCPLAALVMLATACESVLLAMAVVITYEMRAATPRRLGGLHLPALADLARQHGWLSAADAAEVVTVLNPARTMAAHPGAYVRNMHATPPDVLRDEVGYRDCLDIVNRVIEATGNRRA